MSDKKAAPKGEGKSNKEINKNSIENLLATHFLDPVVESILIAWFASLPANHWIWNKDPQVVKDLASLVETQSERFGGLAKVGGDKLSDAIESAARMIAEGSGRAKEQAGKKDGPLIPFKTPRRETLEVMLRRLADPKTRDVSVEAGLIEAAFTRLEPVFLALDQEVERMKAAEKSGSPDHHHDPVRHAHDHLGSVDRFFGDTAQAIQDRFPATRPPAQPTAPIAPVGMGGAFGLGTISGSSYGAPAPQQAGHIASGTAKLTGTLLRGADAARHGYNRGGRIAAAVLVAVLTFIGLSLAFTWSAGLFISTVLLVLLPLGVYAMWPTASTVTVGVAWARYTPSASRFWKFFAGFLATLVLFVIAAMWWNPQWDGRWWYTLVLGVLAAALLMGAMSRSRSKASSGTEDHGSSHGGHGHGSKSGTVSIFKLFIALLLLSAFLLFSFWVVNQAQTANEQKDHYRPAATQSR